MNNPKLRFKREDGTDYPEWESGTIGDYYVFKNGLNKEKAAFGQGTPIINYTDVFKNRLLTAKIIKGRVTLNEKEIENHNAMYGDVFFTRTSETLDEVGFCGALIEEIQDCVFSGFLLRGRPKDSTSISPHFAGYYFMTKPIREEIISKSSITTRALTNGRNLSAVNVRMPHIEEQQKIADFLSAVDEVIAQSEAEVQNLEQQKKAAMQKIFSQKVRFKREDGTDYPEWEDCVLSDFCTELKLAIDPKKYPNDIFLEYSMPAFDMDKKPSTVIGNDMNSNRKIVNVPCVLINKLNVRKKRVWKILHPTNNSVCSAEFIPVTSNRMSIDFLEHLALSDRFTARLLDCSTGTSNSQKRVTPDIIMDMSVSIPCLEEQQKIADFLSAYDEAISYAKQELDKWKELKKGLLQQMFV